MPPHFAERDLPEDRFAALITGMMRRITILASILAVSLWCYGGGQQSKSSRLITMHFEEESNSNPKMVTPVKLGSEHRQYFFSKMPTFTASDIQWFYPFTAEDGVTYGGAFRFKDYAARELEEQTLVNHGKLLGIRCSPVGGSRGSTHHRRCRSGLERAPSTASQGIPEAIPPRRRFGRSDRRP